MDFRYQDHFEPAETVRTESDDKDRPFDGWRTPIPMIRDMQARGVITLRSIAKELNAQHVTTARGGKWQANTVKRLLEAAV